MTARDRTPLPGSSPVARQRTPPDLPTERIAPATAAMLAAGATAAAATVSNQDSGGRFGLSVIQIVASTAAAVTAAVIGSRLGVAGTLVGAGLASIVSGVGAAVYGHSLLVTRRQVGKALLLLRPADTTAATPAGATAAAPATQLPAGLRPSRADRRGPGPDDHPTVVIPRAGLPAAPAPRRSRRPPTAVLAAAAAVAVIFAGSLATVTLIETVKGAPLSGGNSGLSILGGNRSPGTPATDPTTVTLTSPTSSAPSSGAAQTTVTRTLTPSPASTPTPASGTAAPMSSTGSTAGSTPPPARASTSAASAGGQSPATVASTAP